MKKSARPQTIHQTISNTVAALVMTLAVWPWLSLSDVCSLKTFLAKESLPRLWICIDYKQIRIKHFKN
jgi:hypothetical protein